MTDTVRPTDTSASDRRYYRLAMRIFVEFGAEISVPVVFFAWLGKRLDTAWGTAPWLLVVGFVLAFAISAVTITKRAKEYGREYEDIGREDRH